MNKMRMAIGGLCVAIGALAGTAGAQVSAGMVYVESGTPTLPRLRTWAGSGPSSMTVCSPITSASKWEVLLDSPVNTARALLSVGSDRRLSVQTWDGTVWSPATIISNDVGWTRTRSFSAAYEQQSGRLVIAYRRSKDRKIYYRVCTGAAPGPEQSVSLSLDSSPQQLTLIAKPGSNDMMILCRTMRSLYGAGWDGVAFGHTKNLGSWLPWRGQPYDGAYMGASGKAVVVWAPWFGSAEYATFDGTTWSAAGSLPGFNNARWMSVSGNPSRSSNAVVIAAINRSRQVIAGSWNGTAWGPTTTVETSCSTTNQHRMDLSFQPNGAGALLVWHKTNQPSVSYSKWNGSAWSASASGPVVGGTIRAVSLAKGAAADEVLMATVRASSTPVLTDYTVYSMSGTVNVGTATVEGLVGQAVPGVSAPTAPLAPPGPLNLTYAAGSTTTLAPGAYNKLTLGDNATLNLSTGNYNFRLITLGTGDTIVCDTSAGDVNIRVLQTITAVSGLNMQAADPDDPGDICVHVLNSNVNLGDNASFNGDLFYVYKGTLTVGSNATLVGLFYSKGNLTIGSGDVDPSDMVTPGGQLHLTQWSSGVPGTPLSLTPALGGSGTTEPFWLCSSTALRLYISRWREVAADE